jgi:hypothetical protein
MQAHMEQRTSKTVRRSRAGKRSHSTAHSFTASLEDFHYHQIGHTTSQSSTLPSDVSLTLLPLRRLRLGGQLLPRPTCSTLGPLHRCITTQHTTTPCSHDKPAPSSTRTHSAPFSPPLFITEMLSASLNFSSEMPTCTSDV